MAHVTTRGATDAYLILPSSVYGRDFDEWPRVDGDNDFRMACNNMLVRKYSEEKLLDKRFNLTFGKAGVAASPVDLLLSKIKYGATDTITVGMRVVFTPLIVTENDTLQIINFEKLPRTAVGRPIIAVNPADD